MPASKAQQAETAERRKKLIGLVMAGVDYETIAERLNYSSRQAASKDMCRILEQNVAAERAELETLRALECDRLNRLQAAIWPAATRGDLKAIAECRQIIAQRCKLLGLNAPEQLEVMSIDAIEAEWRRVSGDLAAIEAQAAQAGGLEEGEG